ncbi:MAG: hypothetical protein AAFV25_02680 [Bacteroidota bacterium]
MMSSTPSDLFPFALFRVGGLPFDVLAAFSQLIPEELAEGERLEALHAEARNALAPLLNSKRQAAISEEASRYFRSCQKAFRKDKLFPIDASLWAAEVAVAESYVHTWQERAGWWRVFEQKIQEQQANNRAALQQFAQEPLLLRGLCFSSHSFLDRSLSYARKAAKDFRKKEFQSERTLLQYLGRMTAKTSPFSTFTNLAVQDTSDASVLSAVAPRSHRLNQYLLQYFQHALLELADFRRQLPLRLNPSIRLVDGSFHFLLNSRNAESLQELEQNDFLQLLCQLLWDQAEGQQMSRLVDALLEQVEADRLALEAYLQQLENIGCLEWLWPLSGTDVDWPHRLTILLQKMEPFVGREEFIQRLQSIQELAQLAATASWKDLPAIQQQLQTHSQLTDAASTDQDEESTVFQRIQLPSLRIRTEQWLYEDAATNELPQISPDHWHRIHQALQRLAHHLKPSPAQSTQRRLLPFYRQQYGNRSSVPLIQVYEAYHRSPASRTAPPDPDVDWIEQACKECVQQKDGSVQLQLHALPIQREQAFRSGAMIQLLAHTKPAQAYVDSLIEGNGKLFGRFLHLFPPSLTEAVRQWNQTGEETVLLANRDASCFNANLHPPMTDWELWTAGSQQQLPPKQQIGLLDLEVQLVGDRLRLYARSLQKEVVATDLGLEALDSRSPMYRLLMAFADPRPLKDDLVTQLNQKYESVAASGIIQLPRISADDCLILQRRQWYVPVSLLPLREGAESESAYFWRLHQWRTAHQLPQHCFVTLHATNVSEPGADLSGLKADDYKPQYMDFASPAHVALWERLVKRVPAFLKVEEMLPAPESIWSLENGRRYVTETVVQFKV